MGLVEIKDPSQETASVKQLIDAENNDRMIIYKSVSAKNNTLIEEVQKIYANACVVTRLPAHRLKY